MFESRYSALDRTVHRAAFATYAAQVALGDIEDRLYAWQLRSCPQKRPVFVTGLPRAGTTLLLECLVSSASLASHSYRDMPFVLIPILWSRLSRGYRTSSTARERAHADGVMIDVDSAEALEEVLWMAFWKKQYLADRILPWRDQINHEFANYFRNHISKIVALRRERVPTKARYISKNNLNLARLSLLRRMFPDSLTIVPFRQPVQHAASLLRQHENFLELQDRDRFVLQYMSAIGHFDFGHDLRPVDFDSWLSRRNCTTPACIAFWIEYWVAAYRHILSNHSNDVLFVCYESLCADAEGVLRKLSEQIGIDAAECLTPQSSPIHSPVTRDPDTSAVPPSLLHEADELYAALRAMAI